MYSSNQITTVHLEITTKCNASCPMCLRTVLGGKINPHLPLTELKLAEIQTIFPATFVQQLKRIYLCGNYGDPIVATDTLEVLRYFRRLNPRLRLELFTNGSARNEQWWHDVAQVVTLCHFGIDGLEDTNHIYRRGTKWTILMRNIQAYIAAGGAAHWDYLVFRHNEHQVEPARELSQKLGFRSFQLKKTGRFFSNQKAVVKDQQEVHSANGELEYFLEMPLDPKYLNPSLAREEALVHEYGSLRAYLEKTRVTCKVAAEKSVYVSGEGLVFPCCWTANQLYPWYREPESGDIWALVKQLPNGLRSLDARQSSLCEIVDGPFFQKLIPAGWERPTFASGKIFACAKTCGQEFDPFRAQFT